MHEGRHLYRDNLCHKNHFRYHCYRIIITVTFTLYETLSDISTISICHRLFNTSHWFWICSDMTLTFNTGTSCWLVWSDWRNYLASFQSQISDLAGDIHRGRKFALLHTDTHGIPRYSEKWILEQCFSTPVKKYHDHINSWKLQLIN